MTFFKKHKELLLKVMETGAIAFVLTILIGMYLFGMEFDVAFFTSLGSIGTSMLWITYQEVQKTKVNQ